LETGLFMIFSGEQEATNRFTTFGSFQVWS